MSLRKEFDIIKSMLDDNLLFTFGFSGSSMKPTILSGYCIQVKKSEEFLIGNIYIYYDTIPTERFVCHRLVYKRGDKLYFRGDNRNEIDKPISPKDVLGEVLNIYKE